MDIKVVVAAHKACAMPGDGLYLPVQAGAAINKPIDGFTPDNSGDNISEKNPGFCELTCLYWAWKNLDADYIGLAHYRRHFSLDGKRPLTLAQAEKLIESNDIILPKKRKYYIETLYSHYSHTLDAAPLDEAGAVISEKYPEYLPAFERLKKRTSAHMFNMMIMKKELLSGYCEWLFDVLFELEKRVDTTALDSFNARFYGRVSELLLDVWLETNGLDCKEIGFIYTEKVNRFKKVIGFLSAKFLGKKYGKSF